MTTVLDDLLVKLGYDADISGAQKFNASLDKVHDTVAKIGTAMSIAGGVIGGVLAKSALDTAEYIDESERLAEVANVTTQELQRMTAGSERYKISQEKLADILKDVNDKVGDFAQTGGGAMADFFENIGPKVGITVEHFKNLSGREALQLYVDSLEKANVSQADMVFYMEAIASDSTMLLPLLEKGGKGFEYWGEQAEKAGKISSKADIANSKRMLDNLQKAKSVFSGFTSRLSLKFIPYFNVILEKFIDGKDELNDFADSVSNTVSSMFDFTEKTFDKLSGLNDVLFDVWDYALYARDAFDELNDRFKLTDKLSDALAVTIGLLVANLTALAGAKVLMGIRTLASTITMLFSPVALAGALILGLFLIVEDFYGFMNGKDSFIGDLLKEYPELYKVVDVVLLLVDAVKSIWTDNKGTFEELMTAVSELVEAFTPFIKVLIELLPDAFKILLDVALLVVRTISVLINAVIQFITGALNTITGFWNIFGTAITDIFVAVFDFIVRKINDIINIISSVVGGFKKMLDGDIIDGLSDMFNGSLEGLNSFVGLEIDRSYNGMASIVPSNNTASYNNQSTVNQSITVNSAEEASIIASRTAQATRQSNYGYI